ncbi:MAG: hypothetical protein AB9880_10450 [Christensenellales bacterium]
MKKNLIILSLALLIALPVFGLAADAATPAAPEVRAAETTPLGGQYGRRWNQTATPDTTAPQTGFVDANGDGLCDNCGSEQGKNTKAPNYIDENKDGVCDHFGTDQQGQGKGGRAQNAQGRGRGMRGHRQGAQGREVQGNIQGQNYADANNDGVCDNFGSSVQRNFGHGRNRR